MASLKLGNRESAAVEIKPLYTLGWVLVGHADIFLKNWSPWVTFPHASYPQSMRHSPKPQGGLGYNPL